jgi:hypothetical protein
MRITDGQALPYRDPGTQHREGDIKFKYLLHGEAGSPQNYELALVKTAGRFFGPQHRHNFDQIRCVLDGRFGDGESLTLEPGQIGYYGEGGYYRIDARDSLVLLLQFGGASGAGFTHYGQLRESYPEVAKQGVFKDGVFRRDPRFVTADAPANQDGYEALWQHIHGRRIAYPRPRYPRPLFMDPQAFDWIVDDQAGVHRRDLGMFTERGTGLRQWKIGVGAEFVRNVDTAPVLLFVMAGGGSLDGVSLRRESAIEILPGESVSIRSDEELQLLEFQLPWFRKDR